MLIELALSFTRCLELARRIYDHEHIRLITMMQLELLNFNSPLLRREIFVKLTSSAPSSPNLARRVCTFDKNANSSDALVSFI